MDFSNSLGVLWRRKGLTFLLLLLTLAGAVGVGALLPWTYKESVTETLLNSQQSSQSLGGGNPYLSFDAAMVEMANVLTLKLADAQTTNALAQQGDTASYQAQVLSENAQNEEPFIQISVSGKSSANVAQTLQGVTASLSNLLTQLQANVPVKSRASLDVISEDTAPKRSTSAKLKPLVGVLGVGLVLTFLIPQAVDGAAGRRRRSRSMTSPLGDEHLSHDGHQGSESDQFRPDHAAATRGDTFQRQWGDPQLEENFPTQHVSRTRQGGRGQAYPEYGASGPDGNRYSESERRW
jgi:hypothetical protein